MKDFTLDASTGESELNNLPSKGMGLLLPAAGEFPEQSLDTVHKSEAISGGVFEGSRPLTVLLAVGCVGVPGDRLRRVHFYSGQWLSPGSPSGSRVLTFVLAPPPSQTPGTLVGHLS